MADITVLYQQTLTSPSTTVSSVSLEPVRAGVTDTIGTGINYTAAGAETLFQTISPATANLLKQALCQGNLSNNDLFNNPELNCAVALGAAAMTCGGSVPGLVPPDLLTCTSPKAAVVNVTNNGTDCSMDFECACPSDEEDSPVNTDGFNPQEIADSVSDCQLKAAKDYLKNFLNNQTYQNLKLAALQTVVGNIFAGVQLQTLLEQINFTIENSGSVNDIFGTLNQQVFNVNYFMSPSYRIVQLLNSRNPGSGDAFAEAWRSVNDYINDVLFLIDDICALKATVTASDIKTFLNALSPRKAKKCDNTFILNEDTCECECPPDHYPCVYNRGIIDALSPIDPKYTRCLPCPSPKVFNSDTCECECPSNKVQKNGACLDPCPEGTVLKEVPCNGEHTQVVLNDDGETLSTTCYDCFCRKDTGLIGVLLPTHVPALTCSGEGEVRLTRADCECSCDRAAGYTRVFPREPNYLTDPLRCRLPCEPNKVYEWDFDDCVCPNRIEVVPVGAGNNTFVRLKTPEQMCGEADGSFGKVWDDELCTCVCPEGTSIYDPETGICGCPSGMVPDQESMSCICPSGTQMSVNGCVPACPEGTLLNSEGECEDICPENTFYVDGLCIPINPPPSGSGSGEVPPSGSGSGEVPPSGSGSGEVPPSGSGSGYSF